MRLLLLHSTSTHTHRSSRARAAGPPLATPSACRPSPTEPPCRIRTPCVWSATRAAARFGQALQPPASRPATSATNQGACSRPRRGGRPFCRPCPSWARVNTAAWACSSRLCSLCADSLVEVEDPEWPVLGHTVWERHGREAGGGGCAGQGALACLWCTCAGAAGVTVWIEAQLGMVWSAGCRH